MRNLPNEAEGRKESQNLDGPNLEMAHGLVPRLEGVSKIAPGES
jgi:hypothetical protein